MQIYPYLLRNMEISRPNQVWGTDITYGEWERILLSGRDNGLVFKICHRLENIVKFRD